MDTEHHRRKVREFLARPPFLKRDIPEDDLDLFCEALTHDSYSHEAGISYSYERLEFLGDAVIELVVCEHIYRSGAGSEENMTDRKKEFVANKNISSRIVEKGLDIGSVMLMGKGHVDRVTKENIPEDGMCADSFEALVAGFYLIYGLEEVRRVVSAILID